MYEKITRLWTYLKNLQPWQKLSIVLCGFAFFKELRLADPFVFVLFSGKWWDLEENYVMRRVLPTRNYSFLTAYVLAFLINDLVLYKTLIVYVPLSGTVICGLILWTSDLLELQISQIFYGTFMATEVAYYTYIYAKVPSEFYPQVTSHTRAALLVGRALSGFLAQMLVSFNAMDYRQLNYISFGAMIAATIWAIFLPPVKQSIYFHRMAEENQQLTASRYKTAFSLMRKHFIDSFSNKYVLKWSLWWALATGGFIQVQVYVQPLWGSIQREQGIEDDSSVYYNGAVEAILTIIGAAGALGAGIIKTDWKHKGELMLCICSISAGAFTLISSQTTSVIVSYVCYILFGGVYHFMITIASAEIAKYILEDSYGLVFGLNTLIALVVQTFLTLCFVTGDLGLALDPRDQFLVYGIYHIIIAALYIVIGLTSWVRSNRDIKKTYT